MTMQTTSKNESLSKSNQTWSIAEVERETGLGKDTLRVWERRYGFPVPGRDMLGERAYPEDQLQRLRLIKRLMDIGHRPGKIVQLSLDQLQALAQSPAPSKGAARAAANAVQVEDAEEWLDWLKQGRTDLIRQKLQGQILKKGLGHVVEEQIAPLCVMVGDAWLRGELSVYQEHLFTESVQAVMREAIAAVESIDQSQSNRRPRVLLTTTPNAIMAPIHDRMPVILPPAAWTRWLDPGAQGRELQRLLLPCPDDALTAHPVGPAVGNPRHEGPELMAPLRGLDGL